MLTQYDIDKLMQSIQAGNDTYLYYVAHMIEPREGLLDEHIYKSASKFKVIKIQVTGISNAYFEYLNFVNNPNAYHTETEESYYDIFTKYINHYTVKNTDTNGTFTKDLNSRMPSIVYGYRREIIDELRNIITEVNDPTPVKVEYVNALEYGDYTPAQVTSAFNSSKLNWKYKKLTNKATVDGIDYQYITSDWYILDIKNFPRTEKPLINVNQYSAYFRDLEDAFNYIEQLEA